MMILNWLVVKKADLAAPWHLHNLSSILDPVHHHPRQQQRQ